MPPLAVEQTLLSARPASSARTRVSAIGARWSLVPRGALRRDVSWTRKPSGAATFALAGLRAPIAASRQRRGATRHPLARSRLSFQAPSGGERARPIRASLRLLRDMHYLHPSGSRLARIRKRPVRRGGFFPQRCTPREASTRRSHDEEPPFHPHGLLGVSVLQGVPDEVRQHLRDAVPIPLSTKVPLLCVSNLGVRMSFESSSSETKYDLRSGFPRPGPQIAR